MDIQSHCVLKFTSHEQRGGISKPILAGLNAIAAARKWCDAIDYFHQMIEAKAVRHNHRISGCEPRGRHRKAWDQVGRNPTGNEKHIEKERNKLRDMDGRSLPQPCEFLQSQEMQS
ncbi:hypothetical protein Tco_0615839 [Tanacetum coccineum]